MRVLRPRRAVGGLVAQGTAMAFSIVKSVSVAALSPLRNSSFVNKCMQGDVPVSLAEFTLDAGDGHTYYDISLVDGYNLPMAIILQPLQNASLDDIPPNLIHPSCEGTVGLLKQKGYDPY